MMVSLDVYRPAAQEQLKSLGEQNNIMTLPVIEGQLPADICRRAISAANLNGAEIILFDTAGRTQIDLQMMSEIKQIENIIKPAETFLVADSLTGQVAAEVAKEFKNTVNLSGIILTRADGDARGGAAVSMKYVSNVPIKFLGIGEKIDNLSEEEKEDRAQFAYEACWLSRERLLSTDVYEHFGWDVEDARQFQLGTDINQHFQKLLFQREIGRASCRERV